MLYLDASLVVALFTAEPHTARLQQWIEGKRAGLLAVSRWVDVEFSAAIAAKVRAGLLDGSAGQVSLQLYRHTLRDSFTRLEIGDRQFDLAERLAGNPSAGLRGGDALHLALASDYRAVLCTLDKRQAEAAARLGIEAELV